MFDRLDHVAPVWFWLVGLALLALGGLMLLQAHRSIEKRADAIDAGLARVAEEARRAHVRIDNDQRQIGALGKQLGWVDDKSFTRVLTGRLSAPPVPPPLPEPSPDTAPLQPSDED